MAWLLGPIDDFLLGTIGCAELAEWLRGIDERARSQLGGASTERLLAACTSATEARIEAESLFRTAFTDRHLRLAAAAIAMDITGGRQPIAEGCVALEQLRDAGAHWVSMIFTLYNPAPSHVDNPETAILFSAIDLFSAMTRSAGVEDALARRPR